MLPLLLTVALAGAQAGEPKGPPPSFAHGKIEKDHLAHVVREMVFVQKKVTVFRDVDGKKIAEEVIVTEAVPVERSIKTSLAKATITTAGGKGLTLKAASAKL